MTAAVAASTLPTPVDDAEAQVVPAAAAASYFAPFHQPLYQRPPPPSGLQPPAPASPTSPAHSPLLAAAPKSILCVPSSPLSTVCSSPFTSPPISRPISRRSSTSKAVRFARCTNASVFPTHSTDEYDRSPIVPTCESESLEIKRCKSEDEEEGWIMCQARRAAAGQQSAAAAASTVAADGAEDSPQIPQLPKHAPTMDNPVEGVHGLIEGGFFVGDERDRLGGTTPTCGAAGAFPEAVIEEGDEGDELDLNPLEGALNDEDLEVEIDVVDSGSGERMLVDDAPDDLDVELELHLERQRSVSPIGSIASSSSSVLSATSSASASLAVGSAFAGAHAARSPSSGAHSSVRDDSPPSTASSSCHEGDSTLTATGPGSPVELSSSAGSTVSEPVGSVAAVAVAPKKKRFGLCGIGKYTRQDIFSSHDSLGGF